MNFTDTFIRRPVLATVVSLLIVFLGLRAFNSLSLREYPEVTYPVINVVTAYPGANAELIQGFITRPLERALARAEGIDYLTAQSQDGLSSISAHLQPGFNLDAAFADISGKVEEERRKLPRDAEDPVVVKETGSGADVLMFLSFSSEQLTPQQITDYLDRAVQPLLSTVKGVGEARIDGGRKFAMRVWLDPGRLAAFGLTAADVEQAVARNNVQSAAGNIRSDYVQFYLNPQTVIRYGLPERARVVLTVYNTLGQQVAVLQDGVHSGAAFDPSDEQLSAYLAERRSRITVYEQPRFLQQLPAGALVGQRPHLLLEGAEGLLAAFLVGGDLAHEACPGLDPHRIDLHAPDLGQVGLVARVVEVVAREHHAAQPNPLHHFRQ